MSCPLPSPSTHSLPLDPRVCRESRIGRRSDTPSMPKFRRGPRPCIGPCSERSRSVRGDHAPFGSHDPGPKASHTCIRPAPRPHISNRPSTRFSRHCCCFFPAHSFLQHELKKASGASADRSHLLPVPPALPSSSARNQETAPFVHHRVPWSSVAGRCGNNSGHESRPAPQASRPRPFNEGPACARPRADCSRCFVCALRTPCTGEETLGVEAAPASPVKPRQGHRRTMAMCENRGA